MGDGTSLGETLRKIDEVYDVLRDVGVTRGMVISEVVRLLDEKAQKRLERELRGGR